MDYVQAENPATPTTPHNDSHQPSSPSAASSPPLTTQPPTSTMTSLCNITAEGNNLLPTEDVGSSSITTNPSSFNQYHQEIPPAEKQAALTSKFKLVKGFGTGIGPPSSFNSFRASLLEGTGSNYLQPVNHKKHPGSLNREMKKQLSDMDIASSKEELHDITNMGTFNPIPGSTDIHVMSPSLASSQVLSKTRPLSPFQSDTVNTHPIAYQRQEYSDESSSCGTVEGILKPDRSTNGQNRSMRRKGGSNNLESKDYIKGSIKETLYPEDLKSENSSSGAKPKGARGRRRPRMFKLKFHHQALPPEYLDHYEASLRQEQKCPPPPASLPIQRVEPPQEEQISNSKTKIRNPSGRSKTPRPITIHEAGNGATEALLRELLMTRPHLKDTALQQAVLARAQSVPSIMVTNKNGTRMNLGSKTPSPVPSIAEEEESSEAKIQNVSRSSRRGRRSKKADLSLAQRNKSVMGRDQSPMKYMYNNGLDNNHQFYEMEQDSMIRSRSTSSLYKPTLNDQNEPLNLCIRDTPIKLEEPATPTIQVKEEPQNSYMDSPSRPPSVIMRPTDATNRRLSGSRTPMSPPFEYNPWGNSFAHHQNWMHDYRLKTEDGLSSGQSTPSLCSQSSHLPPTSPPVWPHFSPPHIASPHSPSSSPMTSPHRHVHSMLKDSLHLRLDERETLTPSDIYMSSPDRMSTNTPPHFPPPTRSPAMRISEMGARKKRSPIYLPQREANSEVSMCKFKFTGGPNPILEEKKMVSVDSSGTMRCYNRGSNAFPKDQRNLYNPQMRMSGKFINMKTEKDNKKIRLESQEHSSCSPATSIGYDDQQIDTRHQLNTVEDSPKRKRRSKKASMREKFEQTLREKGLLIQTQQVQSAEGATYCKFRQLRKITRYLFRSWKDYLPGQLPEDGNIPDHPELREEGVYSEAAK